MIVTNTKLFLVFLVMVLLPNIQAKAQSLERTLLGSSGTQITANNMTLEWSIGELATAYLDNGDIQLYQGFHQGVKIVDDIDLVPDWSTDIVIYPNPVSNYLYLKTETIPDLHIYIYDVFGKLVVRDIWTDYQKSISVESLVSGLYLVTLKDRTGNTASYKIVKK